MIMLRMVKESRLSSCNKYNSHVEKDTADRLSVYLLHSLLKVLVLDNNALIMMN